MSTANVLTIEKRVEKNKTFLILKGPIDERADLQNVFSDISGDFVSINLVGISRINSTGVRQWIDSTKILSEKHDIEFVGCSQTIVNQLNIIENFASTGKILSFIAPYYCGNCDTTHEIMVCTDQCFCSPGSETQPAAPELSCPVCKCTALEFAEDEEKYLFFLSKSK